jgi:predicted lysophospholipase L1 biosynthesis ABC-type transport system permease subunit
MGMRLLAGRDFRTSDVSPGSAIVNETFAKEFFQEVDPVGRWFEKASDDGSRVRCQVVGVVADAPYRSLRGPILPVAYMPLRELASAGGGKGVLQAQHNTTFLVRTEAKNPMALAAELRRTVWQARAGLRVSNARLQQDLIDAQTVRERLLAMLGVFFAGVALLLAGIGLYGVLNYSVLQRRREIGIRVAVGAHRGAIARLVTGSVFSMVAVGVVAGVALGLASARYMQSLFFQVKASDVSMLAVPSAVILAVAIVATVPAVLRALRVDPVEILRVE